VDQKLPEVAVLAFSVIFKCEILYMCDFVCIFLSYSLTLYVFPFSIPFTLLTLFLHTIWFFYPYQLSDREY